VCVEREREREREREGEREKERREYRAAAFDAHWAVDPAR
jgi:hypothetical protein